MKPRYTPFKSKVSNNNIQRLYAELIEDKIRNEMIFDNVLKSLDKGAYPIILTERIEHIKKLTAIFKGFAKNIFILTGGMSEKEERNIFKKLKKIPEHEERLIIATGKYIGEGFDYAYLDTLFLVMPIAWKRTLKQYVGRLHRIHDAKNTVTVYDYIDHHESICKNMYEKRKTTFKSLGYIIPDKFDSSKFHSPYLELVNNSKYYPCLVLLFHCFFIVTGITSPVFQDVFINYLYTKLREIFLFNVSNPLRSRVRSDCYKQA